MNRAPHETEGGGAPAEGGSQIGDARVVDPLTASLPPSPGRPSRPANAPSAVSRRALRIWGGVGATVAAILLLLWMAGLITPGKIRPGTAPLASDETVPGPAAAVRVDEVPVIRESVGTVGPRVAAEVASKVMANILVVAVGAGSNVRKGQLLIRLDGRDLEARRREAEAAVRAARADLNRAAADYKRFSDLVTRGSVTQKEYEDVSARYAMAQAHVQAAEQAVVQARVALGDVEITAPMDGVVTEKLVDAGDLATPGKPLLMLHDPEQLRLEAAVAEELAPRLAIGTPVTVHVDAVDKTFATQIDEIVPRADPVTRTIAVRAALPAGEGLKSGMFGRLMFAAGSVRILSIPQRAVRQIGQLDSVQVVTPHGLRSRQVQTGVVRDGQLEILAGLEPGEMVFLPPDEPHE